MAKAALCIELKAKPGKESDVEAFLVKEAGLASKESRTLTWCATKEPAEPGTYIIFDTFVDEQAREDHMAGAGGQELVEKTEELFAVAPKVHRLLVVVEK